MTTMPDSIVLAMPSGWDDVPMEAGRYRRHLARQVAQMRSNGMTLTDARRVEMQGAVLHRLMAQQNVVIASSYLALETSGAEPTASSQAFSLGDESANDDGERNLGADDSATNTTASGDEAPTLVMASAAVSALLRRDLETDLPLMADVLLSTFGQGAPGDDEHVRYAEIEPPSKCALGDLEAVKLVRLMRIASRRADEHKLFSQSYLVPVANGDAVVVMQFTTVNFVYAKPFSQLFGRIAGTLRVLYPDDPTFLDEPAPEESEGERKEAVADTQGPATA